MSFLNPLFLLAAAAVGLPVAIHLLNLRRPNKVSFSTLAFFNELKKTTIRRIKIKQLILLFLRAAAVLCLAFVLARPFLSPNFGGGMADSDEPSVTAVLLDNSISMERIDANGPIVDQAKTLIRELAAQAKEEDRFVLQTGNGESFPLTTLNSDELVSLVDDVKIQKSGNYMANRINDIKTYLNTTPFKNKKLFVLTDGQATQFQFLDGIEEESSEIPVSWIKIGNPDVQNTAILNVISTTSIGGVGVPYTLQVEVLNTGERPAANQFLSMQFNNQDVGQYAVELSPGEKQVYTFEVVPGKTGDIPGKVVIEGDEFSHDNTYFFSVSVSESRNILWVTEKESNSTEFDSYTGLVLQAATENDAQLNFTKSEISTFNTEDLNEYDAVLLDGVRSVPEYTYSTLSGFVQSGKGLLFFPSEAGDISNYNGFLGQLNAGQYVGLKGEYASFNPITTIDALPEGHPIVEDIFEKSDEEQLKINPPELFYYLNYEPPATNNGIGLIYSSLEDIILYEQPVGNGTVFIFSIGNDPGWSNLPVNPVFAPLYYKTVLYAASFDEGGLKSHTLGSPFVYELPADAGQVELQINEMRIKPERNPRTNGVQISYRAAEWVPGWVNIQSEANTRTVAVNLPSGESVFNSAAAESENLVTNIKDKLNANVIETVNISDVEIQRTLQKAGYGREIWQWFMWAAFILLLTESAVTIWFKTENT